MSEGPGPGPRPSIPGARMLRAARRRFGVLLLALVLLILFAPLALEREEFAPLIGLLSASVLLAALHAARPGRRVLVAGIALAGADFLLGRLTLATDWRWLLMLDAGLWLVTLLFVTAAILESVLSASRVDAGTLLAALCVYLLMGLIGTFAMALAELCLPGSFALEGGGVLSWDDGGNIRSLTRLLALSFATLSGVGGGEVAPATAFGTNAASLLAMLGQIYLAVVIARLVGIVSAEADAQPREAAAHP